MHFLCLVFEQVPLGAVFRRRGFPPLVFPQARHRGLLRGGERRYHHRSGELLHVAIDGDASPGSQVAQSGLLVLQRIVDDAVESADERRSGHGQKRRIRRLQRPGFDGEQDVFRAAQVRYRRWQFALLSLQLALSGHALKLCRPGPSVTKFQAKETSLGVIQTNQKKMDVRNPFFLRSIIIFIFKLIE